MITGSGRWQSLKAIADNRYTIHYAGIAIHFRQTCFGQVIPTRPLRSTGPILGKLIVVVASIVAKHTGECYCIRISRAEPWTLTK